jgi:hypothetical protein
MSSSKLKRTLEKYKLSLVSNSTLRKITLKNTKFNMKNSQNPSQLLLSQREKVKKRNKSNHLLKKRRRKNQPSRLKTRDGLLPIESQRISHNSSCRARVFQLDMM